MITEKLAINRKVLRALMDRMYEERWPMGIDMGRPFRTENGDTMCDITVY